MRSGRSRIERGLERTAEKLLSRERSGSGIVNGRQPSTERAEEVYESRFGKNAKELEKPYFPIRSGPSHSAVTSSPQLDSRPTKLTASMLK